MIGLDNAAFGCSYETSVMASPGGLTLHPVAPTENDKTALRKLLKIQ